MSDDLGAETFTRPNGKTYQPLRVIAYMLHDDAEVESGVIVLGTQDAQRAQQLADELVTAQVGGTWRAVRPVLGWWRSGFYHGQQSWLTDEVKGRAGVLFQGIEEVVAPAAGRVEKKTVKWRRR
jgi:hypothetical protein